MDDAAIAGACAAAGLAAGRAIRDLVHATPPAERGEPQRSILKPHGGYGARRVDAAAEAAGLQELERLARGVGCAIELVVDPAERSTFGVGCPEGGRRIWASMDAIDGTVKVAGLGVRLSDRVRLGNDGGWAAGFAFTTPTEKRLDDLVLGDFVTAVVVDGNPPRYRAYPQDLVTRRDGGGLVTYEVTEVGERRVHTSTSTDLGQSMVFLDVFQAHDLATRREGDERLGVELYRRLADRHAGGAFDVVRQYANLSALPRVMLGWREPPVWIESQGAAYLVVNENIPNLLASVPIVAGAGGETLDFDGQPLLARRLVAGRTSVVYAANPEIAERVLVIVRAARDAVDVCASVRV